MSRYTLSFFSILVALAASDIVAQTTGDRVREVVTMNVVSPAQPTSVVIVRDVSAPCELRGLVRYDSNPPIVELTAETCRFNYRQEPARRVFFRGDLPEESAGYYRAGLRLRVVAVSK